MAYNYSQEYLVANKVWVERLTETADRGTVMQITGNPHEMDRVRYKLNNLLKSMSMWMPGKAYVRRDVRTWFTSAGPGQITLNFGVPPGRLRGRRPDPIVTSVGARSPMTEVVEGTLTIEGEFTPAERASLEGQAAECVAFKRPPQYNSIEREGLTEYMAQRGYEPEIDTPTELTFTLTRRPTKPKTTTQMAIEMLKERSNKPTT